MSRNSPPNDHPGAGPGSTESPTPHLAVDQEEAERLQRLNRFLNRESLDRIAPARGDRILEAGSGLGLFARELARAAGGVHPAVCVEWQEQHIYGSLELAAGAGEAHLIDVRQGDIHAPPLRDDEWGTFDLVHCRFLLSRVRDPQKVVEGLSRALRPGGRMVLVDDDVELLRLWPALPAVDELWRALVRAMTDLGHDPYLGRKIVTLMQFAGLESLRNGFLFSGGCAEDPTWESVVLNFTDLLRSKRAAILESTAIAEDLFDEIVDRFATWSQRADASLWYPVCWAEGVRPPADRTG